MRVEAHRLRLQLGAYYREEGTDDPLILETRKGSYVSIRRRAESEPKEQPGPAAKSWLIALGDPRKWKWLAAGISVVLAFASVYLLAARRSAPRLAGNSHFRAVPGRTASIAVLPFLDLSPDKSLEYLCEGLTEEIISSLAWVEGLSVVSRASAFVFKNRSEDVRRVGQLLNAGVILEGSVRKTGESLRVTAQLIDTRDGYSSWSRAFESGVGDVFALRDEIVRAVCERLEVQRASLQRSRLPEPKAYQLYLIGRYHWNKRTPENLRKAIACFEQAIAADPTWAQAYAGLADTLCVLPGYGVAAPQEALPKARSAALKALELDENLAEAHASLAWVSSSFDWNWEEAERRFRRALELNPNNATAHHWYAGFLRAMGRFGEALREIDRAQALDPLLPGHRGGQGRHLPRHAAPSGRHSAIPEGH